MAPDKNLLYTDPGLAYLTLLRTNFWTIAELAFIPSIIYESHVSWPLQADSLQIDLHVSFEILSFKELFLKLLSVESSRLLLWIQ